MTTLSRHIWGPLRRGLQGGRNSSEIPRFSSSLSTGKLSLMIWVVAMAAVFGCFALWLFHSTPARDACLREHGHFIGGNCFSGD